MDELDYWRLCDELTVHQAALLVVGIDPSGEDGANCHSWPIDRRPRGYEAARTAIGNALWRKSIVGEIKPDYEHDINGYPYPVEGSFSALTSLVNVDSLRLWLTGRGFTTGFFFPVDVDTPDYLDPQNPRYAPKLAAAIRAWQAVTDPGKRSVKQALDKWLRENAAECGLTDDEGNIVKQAVEDCSKVANWNQKGGAPTTPNG